MCVFPSPCVPRCLHSSWRHFSRTPPFPPHPTCLVSSWNRSTAGLQRKVARSVGKEGKNVLGMGCFQLGSLRRQGVGFLSLSNESFKNWMLLMVTLFLEPRSALRNPILFNAPKSPLGQVPAVAPCDRWEHRVQRGSVTYPGEQSREVAEPESGCSPVTPWP